MALSNRNRPLDCAAVPADHDLAWSIVVCHRAYFITTSGLGCDSVTLLDIEAEQRRHRSLPDPHSLLHCLAAQFEQTRPVPDRDRPRGRQRRIFAERMPRNE